MARNLKPLALLVLGILLVTGAGRGCTMPSLPWPAPLVVKHPDAWVVLLEESGDRTKSVASLLQDWNWRKSLEEREISFRVYDQDQPEADSYKKLSLELPSFVFITPGGKVVKTAKIQDSDAKKQAEILILEVLGK